MRRRVLLTDVSMFEADTTAPAAGLVAGAFGTPFATAAVGVELDFAAPSATRAAGVVPDGTSFTAGDTLLFVSVPGSVAAARPS